MGILHAGILNSLPDACVTAICEKDSFLIRAARSLLPKTIAFYKDPAKMVANEELGAVFITTPIRTHVQLITELARTSKDLSLFVEKPLAASYEEARIACETANGLRGIHMVGFQKRFSPIFQKAREFIQNGSLGDLIFFRAYSFSSDVLREGGSWRFRSGSGGVLLDLAPHVLDLMLWLFGEPAVVAALEKRVYSSEVDDYVHAVLSFKTGLKGHVDACWSIRSFRLPEVSIEVHGKNGMLRVTDDFLKVRIDGGGAAAVAGTQTFNKQSFDSSVPFLLADPEFTKEDEAFLLAVRESRIPDLNFFEAAKVNAIIDQIDAKANPTGE